jgi:tRNA(Ile2) C34 agmatinyltransferase TiaS
MTTVTITPCPFCGAEEKVKFLGRAFDCPKCGTHFLESTPIRNELAGILTGTKDERQIRA